MKIVMQTPNYLPATRYGGPIRSCHGLASALVRQGCEVDVVTSNVDGDEIVDIPVGEVADIDGVQVRYYPVNSPKRIYASSAMREAFDTLIPNADLLHINGMFLWPSVQAVRTAKSARVPYIVTPRGMLAPELIRGKSTLIKKTWIALFERSTLRHAKAIHVTANLEAEGIRQQRLDLAPMVKIPNGVETPSRDQPDAADQSIWQGIPSGKRIAFLARLDWKKGVDLAINAVMALPDTSLLLAGPDQIGLKQKFELQIREAGHGDRIRFIGALDDQDKWRFLAGADVLMVPSLHENFGNTVVEALAVGTPVLCTHEVGAGEWASQLDPECLVPRSAASFAEAIEAILANPSRRERIRREAPGWVASHLGWDAIAQQFLAAARVPSDETK